MICLQIFIDLQPCYHGVCYFHQGSCQATHGGCCRVLWETGKIHRFRATLWPLSTALRTYHVERTKHNIVVEGLPRTNNHAEGWHHRTQPNVGAYRANLGHFLDVLRREQSLSEVIITQIQAGQAVTPQCSKYKAIIERLVTVVGDCTNRLILECLRGIAHNIQI